MYIESPKSGNANFANMTNFEERLLNPKPGGAIEAARDFGIDLSLLVERLRLTPEERLRDLQSFVRALEEIRGAGRQNCDRSSQDVTTLG